ncbi:MAG: hypothetical protein JNN05_04775, partial [Candidatus Omnitrophica bacterium]|nr:hypothetical protein [Candidatus Omnitrophota bacterium]
SAFEIGSEITKYFRLLPDDSPLKVLYNAMLETKDLNEKRSMQDHLRASIRPGDINVNIMTKLDRNNYGQDKKELPQEFSDALSALRGYAQSTLNSAIVFSAGFNRRLYSYIEEFKDFYADTAGFIQKRVIIKVSDYRSALIQGRFLAKKGIWVSEYRIESGLNCGGHAFATDGFLMGPILEEFKAKRQELVQSLHTIYNEALKLKNKIIFSNPHPIQVTAQGGIGTSNENRFLLDYYEVNSTGWATPFLLVPEATNVDRETLEKLAAATQKDLYLSPVSPLGVPFNNLRHSQSDEERDRRIERNRPGSACPKGYLVSNTEFTQQPICTASRQYQKLKIDQLNHKNMDPFDFKSELDKVLAKSCICNDLAEGVFVKYQMGNPAQKRFSAVCPGPNLAYFSKVCSLQEMIDHIYGRCNVLNETYRPHMFVNELKMYVDYFIKEATKELLEPTEKQFAYWQEFYQNLMEGIVYYQNLFPQMANESVDFRVKMLKEVENFKQKVTEFFGPHLKFAGVCQPSAVS